MDIKPIPRKREQLSDIMTLESDTAHESTGIQFTGGFKTRAEAEAFRPPWYGGGWPNVPSQPLIPFRNGRTMNDYIVPGFHRLINDGVVVRTNPRSSQESSIPENLARFGIICKGYRRISSSNHQVVWFRGTYFARPSIQPPVLPADEPARLTAARAKMQSGYLDALTSLSEFHKTVSMIIGFKRRVKEGLISLLQAFLRSRRKPFRSLADGMRQLSSFWLEYRYGWRILWYEYNSIVNLINDMEGELLRRPFRDERSDSNSYSTSQDLVSSQNQARLGRVVLTRTYDVSLRFRGGCLGELKTGSPAKVNIPVTAWELLPLSFVLDMFWNVGDTIQAYNPMASVSEKDAWLSTAISRVESLSWSYSPPTEVSPVMMSVDSVLPPTGSLGLWMVDRRIPKDPGFIPPTPEINLSIPKALDLGSLAVVISSMLATKIRR